MQRQKLINYLGILFLFISPTFYGQQTELQFMKILDSTYSKNQDAIGIMIHVEAPDKNISWTYAVGSADKSGKVEIDKNQPVLIASNTKTYLSAAILKLVEIKNCN